MMRASNTWCKFLWLALLPVISLNAQTFSKLETPNFEILTTGDTADAKNALAGLEQARAFFAQSSAFSIQGAGKVRVIAFRQSSDYAPYRLHQAAFGHFYQGSLHNFIVLTDLHGEHREALIHEYTHFVVRQSGYNLPLWLNEGIADVYSSIAVADGTAVVGLPLQSRLRTIQREGLMPLTYLLSRTRESSRSGESKTISAFYAQSWALAHMLRFHPSYAPNFPRFLSVAGKGLDMTKALQVAFGRDTLQIQADLTDYLPALSAVRGEQFPAVFEAAEPCFSTLSDMQSELVVADLLAEQPWTRKASESRLLLLANQYPDRPEIEAIFSELSWQKGNKEEARKHLERAAALGDNSAATLFRLAEMERETGATNVQLMARLKQVLSVAPQHADATFNLAVLQFNGHQLTDAAATLSSLKVIRPEWECTYYCLLAYCELHSHHADRARTLGHLAKQHAGTNAEKTQSDQLMQRLSALGA